MGDQLLNEFKNEYPGLYFKYIKNDSIKLPPEIESGNIEYKRTLVDCSDERIDGYASQMQWRITENLKKLYAVYYIGVNDDGSIYGLNIDNVIASIDTFIKICSIINASITGIYIMNVQDKYILRIGVKNKKILDQYDIDI